MKPKTNGVMMQYFEWYVKEDPPLWTVLKKQAKKLHEVGIHAVWMPPAYKGSGGIHDVGYGAYDLYDLGEFKQKGTIRTKYGTKQQYLDVIAQLHKQDIDVYADIVLNHKMGADEAEMVPATMVNRDARNENAGEEEIIEAWTKFTFPMRKGKYSDFTWNWTHFDGVDYDGETKRSAIFRLYDKAWDDEVSQENQNYDYLMGADIDFKNQEVIDELHRWGNWYYDTLHMDGVRLDACKHIHFTFFKDWLADLRTKNPELFSVGEYWSADLQELLQYIEINEGCMHLFDVPLHMHFHNASCSNGQFDMRKLLEDTLVSTCPTKAVTFVDNHDTQPSQALSSWVLEWFKPLAYSVLLLRQDGYPCIFYGDYYGIEHDQIASMKSWLDVLLQLRQTHSYGHQHDYFDDFNIIGWTREGDDEHPHGLACILSDSIGGKKCMYVGEAQAGKLFVDALGNRKDEIRIDESGIGEFICEGGSVSIYIEKGSMESKWQQPIRK